MDGTTSFADVRRGPCVEAGRAKPALRTEFFGVGYDLLAVWDVLTIGSSGLFCSVLYTRLLTLDYGLNGFEYDALRLSCIGALIAPLVLRDGWARASAHRAAVNQLIARTGQRVTVLLLVLLAIGFVTDIAATLPTAWIAAWFSGIFCSAVGGRLMLLNLFQLLAARGVLCDRVALLGSGEFAEMLVAQVAAERRNGVRLAAVLEDGEADDAVLQRSLARLLDMGRAGEIDRVLLALPAGSELRVSDVVSRLKALDVEVTFCAPLLGLTGGRLQTTEVAGVPQMVLTRRPHDYWGIFAKEMCDHLIAFLLILALAPIFAAVALLIRADSPGPIVFRQRRHGCNGNEFDVFKFRTMRWQGDRAATGESQTARGDKRVTRIGTFLRRTSLDELPQLFNVLNGTMSLVGPRPHPVVMRTEDRLGEEIIEVYAHRHRVKPGITGWAQINGFRGATDTAEQVRKRVEHDIYYIDNWSLSFDVRILLITPLKVLFQRSNAF